MTPKIERQWLKSHNDLTLDGAIDLVNVIQISDIEEVEYPKHMKDWYAVIVGQGINAYFATEQEALSYRLNFINRILNK